jgi:hypothetical protein
MFTPPNSQSESSPDAVAPLEPALPGDSPGAAANPVAALIWIVAADRRVMVPEPTGRPVLAVVRLQMRPDLRKVDKPVDLAKQVIETGRLHSAQPRPRHSNTTSLSLRLGLGGAGRDAKPARNENVACHSSPVRRAMRFAH